MVCGFFGIRIFWGFEGGYVAVAGVAGRFCEDSDCD